MKLNTTWNEHGKVWYYFTTPQEAQAACVEGVALMQQSASGAQLQPTIASRVERKQLLTHLTANAPLRCGFGHKVKLAYYRNQ